MGRRLIVWVLVTLDGCFEGPSRWDLEFDEMAWGPELEAFSIEQFKEIGLLLFGRVTYEGMAAPHSSWAESLRSGWISSVYGRWGRGARSCDADR